MSRTLVITNDFPPRRGGIENFVFSLCEAMPPDEVVVYTSRTKGSAELDLSLKYPVFRDRTPMLLPTPRVARNVEAVARAYGCDRVIFGASAPLGLLAAGLRRNAGVTHLKAITHGHEVWWARVPIARQALNKIGDDVDVVTYVSEYCRDRIAPALSPAARTRMRQLSPTVDTDRFHPGIDGSMWRRRLGMSDHAPVVVTVSRLVPRKGQDMLIKAWPEVVAEVPEARLVIMGNGPSRRRLGRLARRSGVEETIHFVPGVTEEELPSIYGMADVFALPCRTRLGGLEVEGFGIVFLEAAASGLPVVAGVSGGSPEVTREVGGTVVDPRDSSAIAEGILGELRARDVERPSS